MNMITRRSALSMMGSGAMVSIAGKTLLSDAIADDLTGSGKVIIYDGAGAYGAAQKAAYFEPFEEATGIKVITVPTPPVGAVRTSIIAGAPSLDVMIFPGGYVHPFIEEGLLEKIDFKYFRDEDKASFKAIKPNEYMVPALFYSMVLAYDSEVFGSAGPTSWADMLNATEFPGKRTIFNAGEDILGGCVFEIAMLMDGADPQSVYPIDFDRAFKSLDKLKGNVLRFWNAGAEPMQMLSDGSVSMAAAWNGRVLDLKRKGVPVELTWNQAILQWDAMTVLRGAKNKENAMKFIAFAARKEAQAKFSSLIDYGVPNADAFKMIDADRAASLPGNPDNLASQIVQNYDWWAERDAKGKSNSQKAVELWQHWITK